jgi:SulP family sulfate permease
MSKSSDALPVTNLSHRSERRGSYIHDLIRNNSKASSDESGSAMGKEVSAVNAHAVQVRKTTQMQYTDQGFWTNVNKNFNSGLSVALVNLPLSLSLSVAAMSSPQTGPITAIIGGIIGGIMGGSHHNIIGPTGPLCGYLASAVLSNGAHYAEILSSFAILNGFLIFLVLILELDRYIEMFPSSVGEGFKQGVAINILIIPIKAGLGLLWIPKHDYPIANYYEIGRHILDVKPACFIVCVIWLAIFLNSQKFPKIIIPWPIIIVSTGILVGYICSAWPDMLPTVEQRYGDISFIEAITMRKWDWTIFQNPSYYVELFPITMVSLMEILISAKVAEQMTNKPFRSKREIATLGIINLVSGLFGGLPATAGLERTVLNIKSGASHRASAFVNGMIIFIICGFLFEFFKYLPLAVVGARTISVAYRMIDINALIHYYGHDREKFWVMMIVAGTCITLGTTYGVILGLFLFLMTFGSDMKQPYSEIGYYGIEAPTAAVAGDLSPRKNHVRVQRFKRIPTMQEEIPEDLKKEPCYMYKIIGFLNHVNIKKHDKKIQMLPLSINRLVLDLRYIVDFNLETCDVLKAMIPKQEKRGFKVQLLGVDDARWKVIEEYNSAFANDLQNGNKLL